MDDEILLLTTEQWQALGTIVLVLVAGAALMLNGRSGHHAKQAAQASEKAAQAASEAAAAQMTTTPVTFRLDLREAQGGRLLTALVEPPIRLTCVGANVYVHELRLATASAGRRIKTYDAPCPPMGGVELPKLVHTGDSLGFDWPGEPPSKGASFDVVYSFGGAGTSTFTRRIGSRDPPAPMVAWA